MLLAHLWRLLLLLLIIEMLLIETSAGDLELLAFKLLKKAWKKKKKKGHILPLPIPLPIIIKKGEEKKDDEKYE